MRPVILTFTAFYLPGYLGGGPIRTIANMVERLGADFDFRIVTTDRDAGDSRPYPGVQIDAWNVVGKAQVFYASVSTLTWRGLARLMTDTAHDLVYLNSFFDTQFSLKPMFLQRLGFAPRCPIVIAPRGEFSIGAIKLKSWKKMPFVMLMQIFGIYKNVVWHASTALEIADIRRAMGVDFSRCYAAPNITEAPRMSEWPWIPPSISPHQSGTGNQPLRICFLSRISSKKNLDYALQVLSGVSIPVQFDIFGPQEIPVYWEMCQQLISSLPANIRVSYRGKVEHSQVCSTISKYELFFLPTRGENFGHVFIESWLAGVPVLVSDQTPWRRLEEQNLGWDIPLDSPEEFVRVLEAFADLDGKQRQTMRQRCLQFANEKAEGAEALQLNRRLLLGALGLTETKLPTQG